SPQLRSGGVNSRHLNVSAFLIVALAAAAFLRAMTGCGGGGSAATPVNSSSFPQPQVRMSSNHVLKTTLRALIASNSVLNDGTGVADVIEGPTFEGTIPGPTMVVHPGDRLEIDVVNEFPANPPVTRQGAFPHEPYTINLHTHGLEVSPQGNADNVFRTMEPGTTNRVSIQIPSDHPSGTFWYHPHQHGAVTFNLMGGMAGMLIIKGGKGTLDGLPEIRTVKDLVMDFQVLHSTTG